MHPGSQAEALGRQRAQHKHTDRVKVGWEVVEVGGASCTVECITSVREVSDDRILGTIDRMLGTSIRLWAEYFKNSVDSEKCCGNW